jgi:hypothetical protein
VVRGTDRYPAKGDRATRRRASGSLHPLSARGSMSRSKQQRLEALNGPPADSAEVLRGPGSTGRRLLTWQSTGLWIRMPRFESSTPSLRPRNTGPSHSRSRHAQGSALEQVSFAAPSRVQALLAFCLSGATMTGRSLTSAEGLSPEPPAPHRAALQHAPCHGRLFRPGNDELRRWKTSPESN